MTPAGTTSAPAIPVAIAQTREAGYPHDPPFDPPEPYPELPAGARRLDPGNTVYAGVREALLLLGLDAARHGTAAWNPLGAFVRPGDRVVIKPNLVRHFHGGGGGLEALVTHGSVVRAVLDYALIALKGSGSIVIGDSPLQYADFGATIEASGISRVIEEARGRAGVPIAAVDFRRTRSEKRGGLIVARVPNAGDPDGYRVVDLKSRSAFSGLAPDRMRGFRVTQYDPATMAQAHNAGAHAYLLPASILQADVILNLPKLKTHRKAGITAAMKNLVGINGSKDWLPHHTAGALQDGGDEYQRRSLRKRAIAYLRDRIEGPRAPLARRAIHMAERAVKATGRLSPFPDPYWEGSWHGNDTIWRMVHDLHRALFFADAGGVLRDEPQRRYFALVDAVVAGEGDGPMRPTPRRAGLLVAGADPAAVDLVCCRLMGFDERRIPLLSHAIGAAGTPGVPGVGSIAVRSGPERWCRLFDLTREETLRFEPPASWAGSIELGA